MPPVNDRAQWVASKKQAAKSTIACRRYGSFHRPHSEVKRFVTFCLFGAGLCAATT